MPPERTGEPCCHEGPRCGHIASERNRYFTGKYMAARDFRDEQHYFLSRHRLHNRLLHGWGVICGLTVDPHWDPRCADRRVIVRRGIAVDCCGRELILPEDTVVEVWPAEPEATAQTKQAAAEIRRYVVYLRYCEEPLECVPALYDDACGCEHEHERRDEANRIKEVARLEVMPFDELDPKCWPIKPPKKDDYGYTKRAAKEKEEGEKEYDDCSQAGDMPGCLDPDCPCGHIVPLAVITPAAAATAIGRDDIDASGQRLLRTPPEHLTHIVDINWPHGGSMSLADLQAQKGQLRIKFDRKILPNDGEATGINEHTFVVQYGGVTRTLEFLPSTTDSPVLEDEHIAVFTIEEPKLDPRDRRGNVAGNVVYITLKCDFILDCRGNPVDGDHLKGQLPSGDGVKGGHFESWFRVTYE